MIVFDAKIAKLLKKVIKVDTSAHNFAEQYSYNSKKSITNEA